MSTTKHEKVAGFRKAELYRDTHVDGSVSFCLTYKGRFVARDPQFKYLNQIMYQIG